MISLVVLITLSACNKKPQQQVDNNTSFTEETSLQGQEVTNDNQLDDEWAKQTTISTAKPMVVDFYADWCGPCKELAPILDELEQKHHGEVIFQRINVDEEGNLAEEFNVDAIPTLLFVTPKGEYVTMIGYHEMPDIEACIAQLLIRSTK